MLWVSTKAYILIGNPVSHCSQSLPKLSSGWEGEHSQHLPQCWLPQGAKAGGLRDFVSLSHSQCLKEASPESSPKS